DSARAEAARAEFQDLLRLARRETSVSTFALENDAIVEPSPLLEDVEHMGLEVVRVPDGEPRVFADEALVSRPPVAEAVTGEAREWLDVRLARPPANTPAYGGLIGPGFVERTRAYAVSAIDRYLDCPFKYFAASVLRLTEEVPDPASMSPKARGIFEHEVFRAFFDAWERAEGGAIGPDRLDRARSLFAAVAAEQLSRLPDGEAALERMRLLGSPASAGLGEIVLAAEAVRPVPVRERLLEHPIEGEFELQGPDGGRRIRLRGKADRVDLLEDRTLRVIDYKSGRAPDDSRSIQLPIYAVCVQQQLQAARGQAWGIAEASYLAFGERDAVRVVVSDGPEGAVTLSEGQARLIGAVEGIERGDFPVKPATTRLCASCGYAPVCRRDYAAE
ncbi:MAG: PD-(D/E)XK nuclease family protein, partial [Acidobacteria bacterium]